MINLFIFDKAQCSVPYCYLNKCPFQSTNLTEQSKRKIIIQCSLFYGERNGVGQKPIRPHVMSERARVSFLTPPCSLVTRIRLKRETAGDESGAEVIRANKLTSNNNVIYLPSCSWVTHLNFANKTLYMIFYPLRSPSGSGKEWYFSSICQFILVMFCFGTTNDKM